MKGNIKAQENWYIDDGTLTFTTHTKLHDPHHNLNTDDKFNKIVLLKNKIKLKIIYNAHGLLEDASFEDINFFTMFALKSYSNETIVQHHFPRIKELFLQDSYSDDTVYILGQPWCRISEMSPSTYKQYLEEIIGYFPNDNIRYIPHKLELNQHKIRDFIDQFEHVEFFVPDEPIEFYFLFHNKQPKAVVGFVSTALFTLKKLFPDSTILSYAFDTKKLSKFHQNNIAIIQQHYASEGIHFIGKNPNE
jgi:hypothetical protein